MDKKSNLRQMPKNSTIVQSKSYSDLLYAWLQLHSERVGPDLPQRRILKSDVKWTKIEKDFTRTDAEGNEIKVMGRKTIAKYFQFLQDQGLVYQNEEDKEFYYLTVLENDMANLIEYNTLSVLTNTLQRHCIDIYLYLVSRWYANGSSSYIVTIAQIKNYIGIATSTTSNNLLVSDTLLILQKLGLIKYKTQQEQEKTVTYITGICTTLK